MLNKKVLFVFVFLLSSLSIYAESGRIGFIDSVNAHHEYSFNNGGKQNRYRIQMCISHYAFYIDTEFCNRIECFPNYGIGISREQGSYSDIIPNYSVLAIFPEIILKDEKLKEVFSIKGISREEAGYNYNCYATDWEIYEKGLALVVLLINDIWNNNAPKKLIKVYLELKEDGKYYQTQNTERFGKLIKNCSAYDYIDSNLLSYYRPFVYHGYSIYKMGNGKNIENVLISNILYYNKINDGIEFITPYGCGFFDFKTESMSLVPKEKYLGKKFTYAQYYKESKKTKEKTKIITEEDFILPDIKVPIEKDDLELYLNKKQLESQQKEVDCLLKVELMK